MTKNIMITIDTQNDAFCSPERTVADVSDPVWRREVTRILCLLLERIIDGDELDGVALVDLNGNTVGMVTLNAPRGAR